MRIDNCEAMMAAFRQEKDDKAGQELKGMMTNLKSKYKFLDTNENQKENTSVATQVAVLEEKFA